MLARAGGTGGTAPFVDVAEAPLRIRGPLGTTPTAPACRFLAFTRRGGGRASHGGDTAHHEKTNKADGDYAPNHSYPPLRLV